ncbi:endonuclease [Shewanella sp. OPT22]|nr:endonuclease [Shewanella sp. OPT22]
MKKFTISAAALAVSSLLSQSAFADIIISEYVEGSSNNKAIELHNTGDQPVDLTGYRIVRYKDGSTSFSNMARPSGEIAPGGVHVYAHSRFDTTLLPEGVVPTTVALFHNGGDAVALIDNHNIIVDTVGVVPTPRNWGKDVTLQRNSNVTEATSVYNESEWTAFPRNYTDGLGSVANGPAPVEFSCETIAPEGYTSIQVIQGEGGRSPLIESGFETTETFNVRGVVTKRMTGLYTGFFMQTDSDNNRLTSDGIFVETASTPGSDIEPGAEVCVNGIVKEFFGQTRVVVAGNKLAVTGQIPGVPAAQAVSYFDGETTPEALERFEGMHVALTSESEMHVTRNYSFDFNSFRNNMVLSRGGAAFKPTQIFAPETAEAKALADLNLENRLFIDTDVKPANGELPYYPQFGQTESEYIRTGALVNGLEGVLGYSYGAFRLVPTNTVSAVNFEASEKYQRQDAPAISEGGVRVASFNVLNLFNDSIGGAASYSGQNRGTDNPAEYELQKTKIVNAIQKMDADILGLMEIENNGFESDSAIQDLVATLNAGLQTEAAPYKFVRIRDEDASIKNGRKHLGSDAIMVGLIYREGKVSLAGDAMVVNMPEQHAPEGAATRGSDNESSPAYDKYMRKMLVQGFSVPGQDKPLFVAVNHFKSKGSACLEDWVKFEEDDDAADLQGHCNGFRVAAAKVAGDFLNQLDGDVLILGDLNAYGMEDPLLALGDYDAETNNYGRPAVKTATYLDFDNDGTADQVEAAVITKGAGFTNLNTFKHGNYTFSYTYEGEFGNLDHALGNESVLSKVEEVVDWHINSTESNMFEYSSRFTGSLPKYDNAFSASDHDPVLIKLNYVERNDAYEEYTMIPRRGPANLLVQVPDTVVWGDIIKLVVTPKAGGTAIVLEQRVAKRYAASGMVKVKLNGVDNLGEYNVTAELLVNPNSSKFTDGDETLRADIGKGSFTVLSVDDYRRIVRGK